MISLENISKSYGSQVLFEKTGFKLNQRERAGIVGRNGHGKTTLFRLITGAESSDEGSIIIPKNYRIGYVQQHIKFSENTVLKEGMLGLPESESDHHWKVERVLSGLGFSDENMAQHPEKFSGGYQVRLNLAKVLVSEPDLLLLDEPTNYLDITSIRWIEQFLKTWPRELLVITHDRGFMDKIVTHVIGIHRKKIRKIKGSTVKYYDQMAQDEEIYEKTRLNDERKRKEMEVFISRFRAKARLANMVQSRIKTLEKMEKKDKLESVQNLGFSFRSKSFEGRHVMSTDKLSFSYTPSAPLINNLSFSVQPKDRICIIGQNGKGKTTLIKLLAEKLSPVSGTISYNPNVTSGFYEQTNVQTLVDSRTVLEELLYCDESVELQMARNIAGAMMFEGDSALKQISVLSGGEKSRVMLGKILATPLNMLLLDEPTNHLDMESCDALLAALDNFPGVVIMVTHNEMFLHNLAERLIVFKNNEAFMFEGGYDEFLEKGGWEDENDPVKTAQSDVPETRPPEKPKINKKELRRIRSDILSERAKVIKPIERKIAEAEKKIETNEDILEQKTEEMQAASEAGDGEKIASLGQTIHACENEIEEKFDLLEELTAALEQEDMVFQERLKAIDEEAG